MSEMQAQLERLDKRVRQLETQQKPGNFTSGAILFGNSNGKASQDATKLFWDNSNDRLGIGTNSPSAFAHISAAGGSKTFLFIEDTSANADTLVKLAATSIGSGSYFIRAQDGSAVDRFVLRGDGLLETAYHDTGTTNAPNTMNFYRKTTGTPATSFGAQWNWLLDDSTTDDVSAAALIVQWSNATHASRTSLIRYFAYDSGGSREYLRGEASGTAAKIGFLGSAASAKQTITGAKGGNVALTNLLTALANYGLITDSTT